MIKVNLLKGEGTQAGQATNSGAKLSGLTLTDMLTRFRSQRGPAVIGGTDIDQGSLVLNLLIILIAPLTLYLFEQQHLASLTSQVQSVVAQLQEQQGRLSTLKSEVADSAILQEKARELSNKIDILTKLSRLRLREVKTLDYIQSKIPDRVWLNDISLNGGRLMIKGYSLTDDDLTSFIRSLESNANFKNVLLVQAKEEVRKDASVKIFEATANVEAGQ